MTSRQRALVLGFAVLGLAATGWSTYSHYQLLQNPGYTSFCDVSESVSCEKAIESAYSTVRGVPVALAGLLWFSLVFILAWFDAPFAQASAGKSAPAAPAPKRGAAPAVQSGSEISSYLFILSTAALAVVLYMAYASFFVLKILCILCAITYVAVIGVFVVSGAASQSAMSTVPGRLVGDLRRLLKNPAALAIASLYLIVAVSAIAFFPREATTTVSAAQTTAAPAEPAIPASQIAQFDQWLAAQPRVPIMIPSDGASVVVVKFNDYQCPPCRQTFVEYKPIIDRYLAQYPGKVKFVTKDFPLESECNNGGVHVAGCEAAAAVRMARMKNRADAMEAWLFDNQPSMSPDLVRDGVSKVAGITDFDAQYPRVLEQVKADVALGKQLGVNRTPTFFINGVKIEGGLRPQFFDAAIASELKRSSSTRQ
jgi:uncharacterized membrane protein/protein-disulfide isomerase